MEECISIISVELKYSVLKSLFIVYLNEGDFHNDLITYAK